MINPKLNINKEFRKQAHKFVNITFGPSTQPFIKASSAKNNTRVLALLMFYETRQNPKKYLKVLIFSFIK